MEIFEYVSVTISIVLGLALARLLSMASELVVARRSIQFHWIPITWAITLFCLIIIVWWQLFLLTQVLDGWRFWDFTIVVLMTLPIYLASSLILPNAFDDEQTDLLAYFMQHGKWGVGAYVAFLVTGLLANYQFFGIGLISAPALFMLGSIAAAVCTIMSRSCRFIGIWTVTFILLQLSNLAFILAPIHA